MLIFIAILYYMYFYIYFALAHWWRLSRIVSNCRNANFRSYVTLATDAAAQQQTPTAWSHQAKNPEATQASQPKRAKRRPSSSARAPSQTESGPKATRQTRKPRRAEPQSPSEPTKAGKTRTTPRPHAPTHAHSPTPTPQAGANQPIRGLSILGSFWNESETHIIPYSFLIWFVLILVRIIHAIRIVQVDVRVILLDMDRVVFVLSPGVPCTSASYALSCFLRAPSSSFRFRKFSSTSALFTRPSSYLVFGWPGADLVARRPASWVQARAEMLNLGTNGWRVRRNHSELWCKNIAFASELFVVSRMMWLCQRCCCLAQISDHRTLRATIADATLARRRWYSPIGSASSGATCNSWPIKLTWKESMSLATCALNGQDGDRYEMIGNRCLSSSFAFMLGGMFHTRFTNDLAKNPLITLRFVSNHRVLVEHVLDIKIYIFIL